jgi:anti-anti-sigma factor
VQVTEHVFGNVAVLDINGKLTIPDADDLLERIVDRLAADGARTIVANLQNVSAIDAGGLGSIVAAYRACTRNLVRLRLVHVSVRIQRVIDITGLATILEIFDSLDAALPNSQISLVGGASRGRSRFL